MWRSCTFRNITSGYRSSTSWACTCLCIILCARDWSREVIWLTWYYLMRATFAVQNSTRWTFGRGVILNTRSKTGERAKSSTRRALKFLELFTQLSIFGRQRTDSEPARRGWYLRNTVNYQRRNGRERTIRWFFGGKKRPNSLRTCEISCLCFNFVVFILFSAHSVWSHLP